MSRRTEWREGYTDRTSLVKSTRIDLGRIMPVRNNFSLGIDRYGGSAKISCGPLISNG